MSKKTKKSSRRFYRRLFRRVRLYLPAIIALLAAMILFLPLSGRWMSRIVIKEVDQRFDMDLSIERLQFIIAEAEAEALGVRVLDPEEKSPPFEITRVMADGQLSDLFAGSELWPDWIIVDTPSQLRLERTPEGLYVPVGPLKTLLDSLQRAAAKQQSDARPGGPPGRTPEITVRNLMVQAEAPVPREMPLNFQIDRLSIEERPTGLSPVHAQVAGRVSMDVTEDFSLEAHLHPTQERLSVTGTLTGWPIPFRVPGVGRFNGLIRDVALDFDGWRDENGNLIGSLSLGADRILVSREDIHGERWSDERVEIRLRVMLDPDELVLTVREASFISSQAEITADGEVKLGGEFPGRARVRVNRLPAAAVTLGKNELLDRLGVRVETTRTTSTLQLGMTAEGAFARPMDMAVEASLRLAGWMVEAPGWPAPLIVESADLYSGPEEIAVRDVELGFGGAVIEARGTMPVFGSERAEQLGEQQSLPGELQVSIDGNARAAFEMLQDLKLMPSEVSYVDLPIRLSTAVPMIGVRFPKVPISVPMPRPTLPPFVLSWGEGQAGMWLFAEPVTLFPGDVRYENGRFTLGRFRARLERVAFRAEGSLNAALTATGFQPGLADLRVISEGKLEDLAFLVGREVTLPRELPRDLTGRYRLEVNVGGELQGDDLEEIVNRTAYRGRLLLDDASATVQLPPRTISVQNLGAEFILDEDLMQIRRLNFRLVDPRHGNTQVTASGTINDERALLFAEGRTNLEFVTTIFPDDLKDVVMEGPVAGTAELSLTPQSPLPDAPDLVRQWVGFVGRPGMRVSVFDGAPLKLFYEVAVETSEPVRAFPREFPVEVVNVKGRGLLRPGYLELQGLTADFGRTKDVLVRSDMHFFEDPPRINVLASVPGRLYTNEWMGGWGEQEWSQSPFIEAPSLRGRDQDEILVAVEGDVDAESVEFLQMTMNRTRSHFLFQGSRILNPKLELSDITTRAYSGEATGNVTLEFPGAALPRTTVEASFSGVNLQTFMDDFLERPQRLDGIMAGSGRFYGQLLNYPTYEARAEFSVRDSGVIGNIIFDYAKDLLEITSTTGGKDSNITGNVIVENMKVFFEDLAIINPNIAIQADGYVDFKANLFFDVTSSIISKKIESIPIVGVVGSVLDAVSDELVSYRVRGTLWEPKNTPIPTVLKHLRLLKRREKPGESGSEE